MLVALVTQYSITRDADIADKEWGFVLAALLFGGAALVLRGQRAVETEAGREFELPFRWEMALLAAVIGLAIFFRFFRFLEFPPGLWYDEAVNGTDAISMIEKDHLTVWRESNFGHSTIFFYLLIVSFKLFGFTVFAMRMVPAVAGLAAVVAFYFLARWLLGPVPALIATAFMAISRFAVTFSRVSWEASLQPLFEIMAVYFLVRALETRSKLFFFMAGGSLAAGIYTYLAFRFVPFVMLFFLVYIAATRWSLIRRNIAGLVVYAVAFVVVVAPLAQYALQNQDQFLARTRDINIFKEIDANGGDYQPLRDNIEASIKMMNVAGDRNGRHNLPGEPMLDEVSAALLVLGLAVCLWSVRDWRRGVMAGWLVLALVPGVFTISIENPSAIRGVGAIPPIFLIVGLAVGVLWRSFPRTTSGLVTFGVMAGGLLGISTVINYHDIFVLQAKSELVYDAFQPTFTLAGELVADEGERKRILMAREFVGHPAIRVLGRGKPLAGYTASSDLIFGRGEQDVMLIIDPRQLGILPTLARLYPNLHARDEVDPFGRLYYSVVTIPASDIDALHQVPLAIYPAAQENGPPTEIDTGFVGRSWTEQDLAGGPISAVWEGYLWIPTLPGNVTFRVANPGPYTIDVDGERAEAADQPGLTRPLTVGLGEHRVRITASIESAGETTVEIAGDNGAFFSAADVLYSATLGDRGFQAIYRTGMEFSVPVEYVTEVPFAVGAVAIPGWQAVEYRGLFDVRESGLYSFALDGATGTQVFVDDVLVADNGGGHAPRRIEGAIALDPGEHLLSIQFVAADRSDWAAYMRVLDGEWRLMDGSEVRPPSGDYVAPNVVTFEQDAAWGFGGRTIEGFDLPLAVAVLPDGSIVVGWSNMLAFLDVDGAVSRTLELQANDVGDLAISASGRIVVADRGARSLIVLTPEGDLERIVEDVFSTVSGVAVAGETAYVASPSGAILYSVPLDGGDVTTLPVSTGDARDRARQPSDLAVGDDGTLYIADFEGRRIVVSPDGITATSFAGIAGTGDQLPHVAFYRNLILVSDPLNSRIVAYDRRGKQRGVFVFPNAPKPVRPSGIDVTDDGLIYIADIENGTVHRLRIEIPPETAAELAEQ
ncbi:MAG: glycosyltransferase family 39 protein [Dehalococcoidia bacterium]